MARFIALPVGQGDAFYLERADCSLLVDGGRSRTGLPEMFRRHTRRDGATIVVCTHNDADHAEGIWGFLEGGFACEEVWLPGSWLRALPDALKPVEEVFWQLVREGAEAEVSLTLEEWPPGLSPLEAYTERVRARLAESAERDEASAGEEGPGDVVGGWPQGVIPLLEAEPREAPPWLSWWRLYPECAQPPGRWKLLWDVMDAAERIRGIAGAAFHRGIPVRWFEFDEQKPSGGIAAIKPVNAREIATMPTRRDTLLTTFALTVSNRESLVFWSPPADAHPGVLFTADSDLNGARLPTRLASALVTAPHHGSDTNARAYDSVQVAAGQDFRTVTWVRSDRRQRGNPGSAYRALKSRCLCTMCHRPDGLWTNKRPVVLFSRGGGWVRHGATAPCACARP